MVFSWEITFFWILKIKTWEKFLSKLYESILMLEKQESMIRLLHLKFHIPKKTNVNACTIQAAKLEKLLNILVMALSMNKGTV